MSADYPSNVEVHRWAEAQPWGHKVSSKAITNDLIRAWNRAHPDRPYVRSQAFHGTLGGYRNHNCRCDACAAAEADRSRDLYHARAFERGIETTRRITP